MKIIRTHIERPDSFSHMEKEWVYNGLDCCVTLDVLNACLPQLDARTSATYDFSRALQGPALEMRLRGVLVDKTRKMEVIEELYDRIEVLEHNLERVVTDGLGITGFNWRSNADLQHLFYDVLGIPPVLRGGKPTVNRDALEKLEAYLGCRFIARSLIAMRELGKKINVLKTEVDPDGRIRTSYNIAGTSTGRFSSSGSEFGTGGNLQNVEESLRSIFVADPGWKFAKFDAKSGESYIVGAIEWNLFHDGRYLEAVELATYIQQLLEFAGLTSLGEVTSSLIRISPNNLSTDITLTASCAKNLGTEVITVVDLRLSVNRPNLKSGLYPNSNLNTSEPSQPISSGKNG